METKINPAVSTASRKIIAATTQPPKSSSLSKDQKSNPDISSLPNDVLASIVSHLGVYDCASLATTSRKMREITKPPQLKMNTDGEQYIDVSNESPRSVKAYVEFLDKHITNASEEKLFDVMLATANHHKENPEKMRLINKYIFSRIKSIKFTEENKELYVNTLIAIKAKPRNISGIEKLSVAQIEDLGKADVFANLEFTTFAGFYNRSDEKQAFIDTLIAIKAKPRSIGGIEELSVAQIKGLGKADVFANLEDVTFEDFDNRPKQAFVDALVASKAKPTDIDKIEELSIAQIQQLRKGRVFSNVENIMFEDSDLENSMSVGSDLENIMFEDSDLENSMSVGSDLENDMFEDSDLENWD
jgi:F-box-like